VVIPVAKATGIHYYFSSSTGSDSNDCLTTSTPCATLAKAQTLLVNPGDRVSLLRGDVWTNQGLILTNSGTAANPIIVDHYGNVALSRPKITGGNNVSGKKGSCIRIENGADYITINNIRTGSASAGTGSCSQSTTFLYGYGVNVLAGSDHIVIENSSSEGNGAGYRLAGDYGRVTNSTASDSKEYINTPTPTNDDSGSFGILLNGSHNEIDHNLFFNNRGASYDYGYDGSDVEIFASDGTAASSNNIHHNCSGANCTGYGGTGASNGFSESGKAGTGTTDANVFEYNSYVSVGSDAASAEAHGFTIRGSGSGFGPQTSYVFRHNTVRARYSGGGTDNTQGIGCSGSCPSSTVITDNIFDASFRAMYNDNSSSTVTYNIFRGQVDTWTPGGTNFLNTDPQLVSDTDLHPTSTSPAVDAANTQPYTTDAGGATVPQDGNCNGTAVADIGAWEYDSPNC